MLAVPAQVWYMIPSGSNPPSDYDGMIARALR